MKACSTVGGGVMFVPETLERKAAISYESLLQEERKARAPKTFGKRRVVKRAERKAA